MARFKSKRKGKYKSRLESDFAVLCFKHGVGFQYEAKKLAYVRPAKYVPDWEIAKDVYIETKGYFTPSDRAKALAVRTFHPKVTLLLLFANADNRLNKNSKTTYGQWATAHGFEWADFRDGLPLHWWKKYANQESSSKRGRRKLRGDNDADCRTGSLPHQPRADDRRKNRGTAS